MFLGTEFILSSCFGFVEAEDPSWALELLTPSESTIVENSEVIVSEGGGSLVICWRDKNSASQDH